eukprot:1173095-Pyramimonas_sp.AAC.1
MGTHSAPDSPKWPRPELAGHVHAPPKWTLSSGKILTYLPRSSTNSLQRSGCQSGLNWFGVGLLASVGPA